MRKRITCVWAAAVWLFLIFFSALPVSAAEGAGSELVNQFDYGEVDKALRELFPEEKLEFKEMVLEIISGDRKASGELFLRMVKDQIIGVLESGKENLVYILMFAVIAAVYHNFSQVFESRQICEISFYIVYLLILALCLNSFQTVMEWVSEKIEYLTVFMTAFCPLYFLGVAIAKGSMTAVGFYSLVLFLIYLVELVVAAVILPAIHIYIMVRVLDYLSAQEYLSKFAELIETIVVWGMKTLTGFVIGLNVVQGMISPAVDAVKRSAVTRTAEAIPGVGDAVGGVTEVVLGTAILVKNGIGVAGLIVCLALYAVPLFQVGGMALLYKLAAAAVQPVSDKRIAGCIECVGDGCRLLMRVVFNVGLLFLLTIVVVAFLSGSV